MKKVILVCAFLLAVSLSRPSVEASETDNDQWNVDWYSVNKTTHQFGTAIGHETWTGTNISFDWGYDLIYGGKSDYIGFIATTDRYFDSCKYKFQFHKLEDVATVSLDGNQLMRATGRTADSITLDVFEGFHELELTYKSYCCQASIRFSIEKCVPNTPPTVEIFTPSNGQNVSNTVLIAGTASDSDGRVESVQLKINNETWVNVTGISPWNYSWNSKNVTNGVHTIQARAYDGANFSHVAEQTLFVNNKQAVPGFSIYLVLGAMAIIFYIKKQKRQLYL